MEKKNNKKNKNNKLFGLFNIVDLLIIIIVIAVLIIGVKIIRSNSQNSSLVAVQSKEIEYVVNSQHQYLEAVEYVKVGDKVYNSVNSDYLGVVSDVKYEEQIIPAFNVSTGLYENYKVPDKYSINITIKGNGTESDEDVIVEGSNIKIGTQINVKGKGYVFISYVIDIILDW